MAKKRELDIPLVCPLPAGFRANHTLLMPDVVYMATAGVADGIEPGDVFHYTPEGQLRKDSPESRRARLVSRITGPTRPVTQHVIHPGYVTATLGDGDTLSLFVSSTVCRRLRFRDQQECSIIVDGYARFLERVAKIAAAHNAKHDSVSALYEFMNVDPTIGTKWRRSSSVSPSVLFDLCWRYRVDPLWLTGYTPETEMGVEDLGKRLMAFLHADELYIRQRGDDTRLIRVIKDYGND